MNNRLQIPLKRFMRNPNASRDYYNPVSFNKACFKNTITELKDPINDRKLILIGTLNASDLLAKRTQNEINKFNPDSVLVQTNPNWFEELNKNFPKIETTE